MYLVLCVTVFLLIWSSHSCTVLSFTLSPILLSSLELLSEPLLSSGGAQRLQPSIQWAQQWLRLTPLHYVPRPS